MSERPPEDRIWDLLRGALATRALAIVADLGVPAALADGPRPVRELAPGADADTVHRLLRALASDGVFAEEKPGVFRHTDASRLLVGPGWSDFAHLFGGIWHGAAGALEPDGEPSFARVHGTGFWEWLADHPAERAAFDRAMVVGTERRIGRLAAAQWRGDETVVDVGGGNGSTLLELLKHHPGLRGVVFDLPETAVGELGERIEFLAGSFFERVPTGDAYILAGILHDWDDERAAAILRTVRAAAPAHARLYVIDAVVAPGNDADGSKWLDLLVLALLRGRERDEGQWRTLFDGTGWEPESIEHGLIALTCR